MNGDGAGGSRTFIVPMGIIVLMGIIVPMTMTSGESDAATEMATAIMVRVGATVGVVVGMTTTNNEPAGDRRAFVESGARSARRGDALGVELQDCCDDAAVSGCECPNSPNESAGANFSSPAQHDSL
jgi:hypothetical protein